MRYFLAIFLSVLSACSGCAGTRNVSSNPPVYDQIRESTVRIEIWCQVSPDTSMPIGLGSGVAVRPDAILTAAHVVDTPPSACPGMDLRVIRHDGEIFHATVEIMQPDGYDIARLSVPAVFRPAPMAPPPPVGGKICGYGWDAPDYFSGGVLQWFAQPPVKCGTVDYNDGGMVQANFHAVKGNSGSGFWSAQGRLVGIVSTAEPDSQRDFWVRGPQVARLAGVLGL